MSEVVEQVIQYDLVGNVMWATVSLMIIAFFAIVLWFNWKKWRETTDELYLIFIIFEGLFILTCFLFFVACVDNLVKLCIAPDYCAAEYLVELGRMAIGR